RNAGQPLISTEFPRDPIAGPIPLRCPNVYQTLLTNAGERTAVSTHADALITIWIVGYLPYRAVRVGYEPHLGKLGFEVTSCHYEPRAVRQPFQSADPQPSRCWHWRDRTIG